MSRVTASLAAALGVIALTLAFAVTNAERAIAQEKKPRLVEIANDDGTPVPVAGLRRAADRVQLETEPGGGTCEPGERAVSRVLPDGTTIGSFTIPPGKIFVMTDLRGVVAEDPQILGCRQDCVTECAGGNGASSRHLSGRSRGTHGGYCGERPYSGRCSIAVRCIRRVHVPRLPLSWRVVRRRGSSSRRTVRPNRGVSHS
jgi:hypothetical protein